MRAMRTTCSCAASIGDQLEAAGCGIAVEDASGVGAAINLIDSDFERFSGRACQFFDEHLDFSRPFGEVIERIEQLAVRV